MMKNVFIKFLIQLLIMILEFVGNVTQIVEKERRGK